MKDCRTPILEGLFEQAKSAGARTLAGAAADSAEVLEAVAGAAQAGLISPLLFGNKDKILSSAKAMGFNVDESLVEHEPDPARAARMAVASVREGRAEVLMKGLVQTADLMRAVLDSQTGLRTGRILSIVYVVELPGWNRLICITDAGLNIAPDLNLKTKIAQNAIDFMAAIGVEKPKVAVISAVEVVNPEMPDTIDAAALAKMSDRGQIRGGIVDGPISFDTALSARAAEEKGLKSPVAGKADILLVSDIKAGNVAAKAAVYMGDGVSAGVVVGARAPIVLTSRSDSAQSKLYSIALAVLLSRNSALWG